MLKKIYKWGLGKVGKQDVNVLYGRRPERGSHPLNGEEWDGKDDPFFKIGIKLVEEIWIDPSCSGQYGELEEIFRLQMGYQLLWTIIERYASLKYHLGKDKIIEKIRKVANEPVFLSALKRVHTREDGTQKFCRVVFDTGGNKYSLEPDNPKKSIEYYYQIRSNSVHRGKGAYDDLELLRESLGDLLKIFKDVLKDAFNY